MPDYDIGYWYAAYLPARTPAPVVARLNEVLTMAVKSTPAKSFFDSASNEAWVTSPEELARFQGSEAGKWGRMIRAAGIEAE